MKFDGLTPEAFLAAAGDAPLKSVALDADGKTAPLSKDFSAETGGVKFSATAAANATLALYRHPGAADLDGLVPDPNRPASEDGLPPPIAMQLGRAVLKYRFGANVSGTAGKTAADWGFEFGAAGELAFGFYSDHDETLPLSRALLQDLGAFKHPFAVSEILALQPGTAVFWNTAGRFSLKLTYNAADLLAGNFTLVQKALQGAGLMKGTFSGGVSVEFSASVEDAFVVCFSRDAAPGIIVSLRKAKSRTLGAGIAASLKVDYASTDALNKLLAEVFQKVLNASDPDIIGRIKQRANYDTLAPIEKQIVDEVIDRLPGKDAVVDRLEKFRELVGNLEKAIKDELKGRLTAAWTYDYERVDTNETVLVARLADDKLPDYHADLLRLRTESLVRAATATPSDPGVVLERLLHKKVTEITHTWGFTLGFSRFRFGGRETIRRRNITRENTTGKRLVIEATRRRDYGTSWEVQGFALCGFDATMRSYRPTPAPRDFDYTLKLGWELENISRDDTRLARALDEAAVLGAIADRERLARARELRASPELKLDEWTDLKLITGVELDPSATAQFLTWAKGISKTRKAEAFAAALPFLAFGGRELIGRDTIEKRTAIYAPIFGAISARIGLNVPDAIRAAGKKNEYASLANQEMNSNETEPGYIKGVLHLHGHRTGAQENPFDATWDRAMESLDILSKATATDAAPLRVIEEAADALDAVWASAFFVRAFGWLLSHVASIDTDVNAGLTRTAVLKGKLNGVAVSHVLT